MTTEGVKRKLTAILSADVKDYSRLMTEDEVATVQRITEYRELIGVRVREHRGRVVDSPGDNLLTEFPSALDSTRCAVEIQRVLRTRNADLPAIRRMEFRIGIHLGDVMVDGERIYGDGVNIAARLEGLAEPGGICISATMHEQVKNKLELEYEDMGEQDVKNIPEPIRVYRVLIDKSKTGSPQEEGASLPEKPSIVVMPFVNMSPDPDQEYFSDGLTEEIITDLSHIHDLLVISRSSAMTFKGTKKTIPEIARSVNVRYVLEGSVRKAGNNLRITAQLIDAATDAHLWAEKYSGTLDEVFDIQEKVSRSIVDALKLKLSPEEKKKIAARPIENVQAYEYYLKANAEILKFTEDAINYALRYLQNAIDIIGDNALLYSGMSFACWNLVNIGAKQEDYLVRAEEYVKKALLVDPESSKANTNLGHIDQFRGRLLDSVSHFKRALEVNQDEILALCGISTVYVVTGKISAAVPYCERLMQIDPLSFPANWYKGGLYYYDGRFNLALQAWRRLYRLEPENPFGQFMYALILTYHKEMDEAISIIDQNAKANPGTVFAKLGLILKYAIKGNKEKAFQEITPDFQKTVQRDYTYSHHLASFFALIDEKEETLNWLENAVNRGFINYPFLSEYDPFFENIRGEERFKKLMERVRFEWEHFKA